MSMMNLTTVTVLLSLTYAVTCSVTDSDKIYQNSLSFLISPSLCQLKLICAISKPENSQLKTSHFMQGISILAGYKGNRTVTRMLEQAIITGKCLLYVFYSL